MSKVARRWPVPHGWLYLVDDICKGCGFCVEYCPRHVLAQSDRFNSKGYHAPTVVDAEACVLCGYCELVCPDFAIWTEAEVEDAGEAATGGGTGVASAPPG